MLDILGSEAIHLFILETTGGMGRRGALLEMARNLAALEGKQSEVCASFGTFGEFPRSRHPIPPDERTLRFLLLPYMWEVHIKSKTRRQHTLSLTFCLQYVYLRDKCALLSRAIKKRENISFFKGKCDALVQFFLSLSSPLPGYEDMPLNTCGYNLHLGDKSAPV